MFNTKFKFFILFTLFVCSFFILGREVKAEDSRVLVWFNGFTSSGENCNLTDRDSCGSFVDSATAVTLGSKPIGSPLTDSSSGFSTYVLWMAGNTTANSNTSVLSGNITNIPTGIVGYSVNLVCDLPGGGSSPFTVNVAGGSYTSSAIPAGSVCGMTIEVNDDPGFTSPCGDGVCSLTDGESCLTCLSDCLSCGSGNIQISVVPQENRVSEGGNLTEIYRVTVTPTNWTGPINLSADCDYPGMSCHFFDTSGSLQIECIAGIGGVCLNTVWDKESHVGTNSGSMVYDLHVRNYNGSTNLPASSIPYLINFNAQGAGYYDSSGDAIWCSGNCSASAAAKLWVDPLCSNLITINPGSPSCSNESATSYDTTWPDWSGPSAGVFRQVFRAASNPADINGTCVSYDPTNCKDIGLSSGFHDTGFTTSGLLPNTIYTNRVALVCNNGGANEVKEVAQWTCTTDPCNSVTFNSGNSGVSTNSNGPTNSNISLSPSGTYYAFCDYGVNANDITLTTSPAAGCVWDGSPGSINGTRYRYTCTAPSSPGTVNISCTMNNDSGPDYFCATPNSNFATVTVSGACVPTTTRTVGAGVCTGIETCDAGGNWPGTYDYSSTNGSSCNDAIACNGPDVCSSGVCSGGAVASGNVTVTPSTIDTGNTATASATAGWTNLAYSSSNTAIATVSGTTVTGVGGGGVNINATGTTPAGSNNCALNPGALTVNPPLCPSSGNTVSLTSNNTTVGSSVTASAPAGWSGGSFSSNNNAIATVSINTVTGQSVGSANISGTGWTAPNSAVNCGLNPATITVGAAPYFDLDILEATQTVTQGGSASYSVELTSRNGFDAIVTLSYSACPTNATCSFAGGNTVDLDAGEVEIKYLDVVTLATTPANTYTLGATGVSGALTDSDTAQLVVDALPTPPTVDLRCNGQDNPTINYGESCDLTWTTTNGATSCTASGNWNGAKAFAVSNGPDTQSNLTANRVYTITCSNAGGPGAPDTVNVTVRPQGPGGGGGGGGGTCGQINLTWNNVSGEAGYNVYRNTVNSSSTAALLSPSNVADDTTFTDSPGTGTFYYWVTYFTNPGAFESSKAEILNNPLGGTSCDGSITTDKDITTINGNAPSGYSPSVGNGNQTPANVTYNKNDIIGFAINILHNGAIGAEDASGVFITDKLINLIEPATDWELKRNGSNILEDTSVDCTNEASAKATISADRYGVCGTVPNQTIYIKIPDLSQGNITSITFKAQLAVASGFTQSSSRFQNSATVSYTKNALGDTDERTSKTPLLLFNVTSIPSKTEVAP